MYTEFVEEWVKDHQLSVWAKMTKAQLKTWKTARKSVQHKVVDQVIELKNDRAFFAKLMIAVRSRSEINLQEAISHYELSSLPRG